MYNLDIVSFLQLHLMSTCIPYRVSIGDNSLLGDLRWGGLFGVDAQFIATEDVKVGVSLLFKIEQHNLEAYIMCWFVPWQLHYFYARDVLV